MSSVTIRYLKGPRIEYGLIENFLSRSSEQVLFLAPSGPRKDAIRRKLRGEFGDSKIPEVQTLTGLAAMLPNTFENLHSVSEVLRLSLVKRLLQATRWPQGAPAGPPRPGLIREALSLLDALRHGCLDQEDTPDIPTGAFELLSQFRAALAAQRAEDRPERIRRMKDALDALPARQGLGEWTGGLLVLEDLASFTPLEQSLLRSLRNLAQSVEILAYKAPHDGIAFARQERLLQYSFGGATKETVAPDRDTHPLLEQLFSPDEAGKEAYPAFPATHLVACKSRSQEVLEAALWIRGLLEEGQVTDPQDIALVLPRSGNYLALVEEIFSRLGIPTDLRLSKPLRETPVVRTLLGFVEGAARQWPRKQLIEVLKTPWLNLEAVGIEGLDADLLDRVGRVSGVLGGREDWTRSLDTLIAQNQEGPRHGEEDPRSKAQRLDLAKRLAQLKPGLLQFFSWVEPLEATQSPQKYSLTLEKLLGQACALKGLLAGPDPEAAAQDVSDLRTFLELLEQLIDAERFSDAPFQSKDIEELLQLALLDAKTSAQPSLSGGVCVVSTQAALAEEWSALALVGFAEGTYPQAPPRIPMLGSSNRLRATFRNLPAYAEEGKENFYLALASCQGPLFFSRPLEEEGTPLVASAYWEALEQSGEFSSLPDSPPWSPDPKTRQTQLAERLLTPFCEAKEDTLKDLTEILSEDRILWNAARSMQLTQTRFSEAAEERYLGCLEDSALKAWVGSTYSPKKEMGITQLESFAKCPFFFFSRHLLGLQDDRDLNETVDARVRGELVHRILEEFTQRWFRDKEALDPDDLDSPRELLRQILDEAFDDPRLAGIFWRHEKRRLLGNEMRPGILDQWLELEAGWPHAKPKLEEWAFGEKHQRPLLLTHPELPPVSLRGRIDRVDSVKEDGFFVWDYKTGSVHKPIPKLRAFVQLQLPLYLLAIERLNALPGTPLGAAYLSLKKLGDIGPKGAFGEAGVIDKQGSYPMRKRAGKPRTSGFWAMGSESETPGLAAWLARTETQTIKIADRLRRGRFFAFRHPEDSSCVERCEFRDICRVEESEIAKDFSPEALPEAEIDSPAETEVEA